MDLLFWSGGKDAFLALEFYQREHPGQDLALITTYDENTNVVPHQNIPVDNIKHQAEVLDLNLTPVPLPQECPNDIYLDKITQALQNQKETIGHLIFGDWYLQDIREWREKQFNPLGYHCLFPIWKKELDELLPVLLLKPVEVRISAVAKEYRNYIRVGEPFNQHFVRQLPNEIDPMGEKGEFHTEVKFKF